MNRKIKCNKKQTGTLFRVFFLICLGMYVYFPMQTMAQTSALTIRGENYGILPLEKNQQPFFNRTNMSFSDIPEGYAGWKYVKINANSTWLPGPLPTLEVKVATAGYITVMVATAEKVAVCTQWASDNGWELIPDVSLSYAAGETGALSFFRKRIEANTWFKVVQPATFSGAIIVAPSIEDNPEEKANAVSVQISAVGWMESDIFVLNALAYANRTYVFTKAPKALSGLQFTRYNGGNPPKLKITALQTGDTYIAISNVEATYKPEEYGWEKVEGLGFGYNDNVNTTFTIYKKSVQEGDTMNIRTNSWQGVLIFSKEIKYTNFISITSPPGTVIHNSKANTKKFVGSPSIVILKNGTYLASHDYFGGIISDAFVYKSTDKGKTWERISEIKTMNWGKLFIRDEELYMIGVAPKGTMGYGNVVILKSEDSGYTWSSPTNSKNGLLCEGYYTCAPTPVLFHKGRIWKSMEDQGKVDGWGPFKAFMMSVDEKTDLMDAANWTFSNSLLYTAGAVNASTWLEGNAVIGKNGSIKNILRLHYGNDDKAGIISVSDDGKTATYNPQTDISNVPGACKKFTIQYDDISKRYWTLSNYVLSEDRQGNNLERVRNTIVLSYSEDMINWTIKDTLLHHSDINNHGFQYADWLFEEDDIIAVFRTAWEDETGNADSQHNANFLTFSRFRNFRYERPSVDQNISVAQWYKNTKSAVALTFDDGFEAHYKYAYPVLQKYNLQGTFFVNSGNLVNKKKAQKERYGFFEDFKEMSDNGQEIASHSLTHSNLTSLDPDDLLNELKKDKENIEIFTGKQCLTHAYPYCLRNDMTDMTTSSLFIAARQCGSFSNTFPSGDKWFSINSDLLTWTNPRSLQHEKDSYLSMKNKIDQLNGNFGVACIHETLPFDLLNTSSTYEIATTEWLDDVCKYLSEEFQAGNVWPTTLASIARYTKEKENLRISCQKVSSDSIFYQFSTWLDPAVYNLPLTIECEVPAEWETVRCVIKNEEAIVSDNTFPVNESKITLDIVPDKESLSISNVIHTDIAKKTKKSGFMAYPNPVHDILYVNLDKEEDNIQCKVFDIQGRLIKEMTIQTSSSSVQLQVGDLHSGMYYIHLSSTNQPSLYSFHMIKK